MMSLKKLLRLGRGKLSSSSKREGGGSDRNQDKLKDERTSNKSVVKVEAAPTATEAAASVNQASSGPNNSAEIVQEYFRRMNAHDLVGALALLSDDMVHEFGDNILEHDDFAEEVSNMFACFEDFHLEYGPQKLSVQEAKPSDSNGVVVVVVPKVTASGHHTGRPYSFGPFEPIEASGKYVKLDPEETHVHLTSHGKICKLQIFPLGEMSGPPGLYTMLGGFPIM